MSAYDRIMGVTIPVFILGAVMSIGSHLLGIPRDDRYFSSLGMYMLSFLFSAMIFYVWSIFEWGRVGVEDDE